jgi:hypothetical protein
MVVVATLPPCSSLEVSVDQWRRRRGQQHCSALHLRSMPQPRQSPLPPPLLLLLPLVLRKDVFVSAACGVVMTPLRPSVLR